MDKSALTRCFAVWLLTSVVLPWETLSTAGAAAAAETRNAPVTDPRLDMVTALQTMGPHPSLGDQAKVFGRFVGTWDVEYTDFSKDAKVSLSR